MICFPPFIFPFQGLQVSLHTRRQEGTGGAEETHLVFFEEAEMATLVRLRPLAVLPPLDGIAHRGRHFFGFRIAVAASGLCVCVRGVKTAGVGGRFVARLSRPALLRFEVRKLGGHQISASRQPPSSTSREVGVLSKRTMGPSPEAPEQWEAAVARTEEAASRV